MSEDDSRERNDRLWEEYGKFLTRWDDHTLGRWISQTLAQISGQVWRQSHPFIGAFRLAAVEASRRGLMLSRFVTVPHEFARAECCGYPLVPLFTRDVMEQGLLCMFCGNRAMTVEEMGPEYARLIQGWAKTYSNVHQVAHWPDERRIAEDQYEKIFNEAADNAERLLAQFALEVAPLLLDRFPAVVWEDQDECLDVRPDDVDLLGGNGSSDVVE